jgi:EAL domain-containing protein (putative c-di-GMP-specific phosphodiesterase class I)
MGTIGRRMDHRWFAANGDPKHSLEIEVIAEGIESAQQAEALSDLGYSAPLPAPEISAQLGSRSPAR